MERFKKNKKGEYFVVPFDNSFESRYPSGLKCLLDKWIKKPYSSLKEACEIADNYAKKAFHDGRLITAFAVVKKNARVYGFYDTYDFVYKTVRNKQAEEDYWSGSNQTSVWFCPEESVLKCLSQDKGGISFKDWFNGLQMVKKNNRWHDRVAFFNDAMAAIRFLKSERANTDEFVLTIQKNRKKINLSNQMFRLDNMFSAQCIAVWKEKNDPAYYTWRVGSNSFPSYGDAVVFCLENEEYDFEDITRKKKRGRKKNIAK